MLHVTSLHFTITRIIPICTSFPLRCHVVSLSAYSSNLVKRTNIPGREGRQGEGISVRHDVVRGWWWWWYLIRA